MFSEYYEHSAYKSTDTDTLLAHLLLVRQIQHFREVILCPGFMSVSW